MQSNLDTTDLKELELMEPFPMPGEEKEVLYHHHCHHRCTAVTVTINLLAVVLFCFFPTDLFARAGGEILEYAAQQCRLYTAIPGWTQGSMVFEVHEL
jgi:hypothetical protein